MRKRVFLGIPLPEELKSQITKYLDKAVHLQTISERKLKIVKPDNLHITVLFIGCLDIKTLDGLSNLTKKVIEDLPGFNLEIEKVDYAPPEKPIRMIWIYFRNNSRFNELVLLLKKNIKSYFAKCKIPINLEENRETLPHVTLVRYKEFPIKLPLPSFATNNYIMSVETVNIFESILSSSGPRYEIIKKISLK